MAATLFAACQTDTTEDVVVVTPSRISVSMEDGSRVLLGENDQTVWCEADEVSVFYQSADNQQWKYDGVAGARSGYLVPKTEALSVVPVFSEAVLVYPYNENYGIDASAKTLEMTIPSVQNYAQNSYGWNDNIMVASGTEGKFTMRSIGGFLQLQLLGNRPVRHIELEGNNGEQLAGMAHVNYETLDVEFVDGYEPVTKLVLNCYGTALNTETPTSFYFVLMPQTLTQGFTATVVFDDGATSALSSEKSLAIDRNTITPFKSASTIANPKDMKAGLSGTAVGDWTMIFGDAVYNAEKSEVTDTKTFAGTHVYEISEFGISSGEFKFRFGDGNNSWLGYDSGVTVEGITVTKADVYNDNFAVDASQTGNYDITLTITYDGTKATATKAVFTKVGEIDTSIPNGIYIIGEAVGTEDNPATIDVRWMLDGNNQKYVALPAGKSFSFLMCQAGKKTRIGAVLADYNSNDTGLVSQKGAIVEGAEAPSMQVAKDGLYHVVINRTLETPTLMITPAEWGVVGTMNNWTKEDVMTFSEFNLETLILTKTYDKLGQGEFKLRFGGDWDGYAFEGGKYLSDLGVNGFGSGNFSNDALKDVTITLTWTLADGLGMFNVKTEGTPDDTAGTQTAAEAVMNTAVGLSGNCLEGVAAWGDPNGASLAVCDKEVCNVTNETDGSGAYVYNIDKITFAKPTDGDSMFKVRFGADWLGGDREGQLTIGGLLCTVGVDNNLVISDDQLGSYSVQFKVDYNGAQNVVNRIDVTFTRIDADPLGPEAIMNTVVGLSGNCFVDVEEWGEPNGVGIAVCDRDASVVTDTTTGEGTYVYNIDEITFSKYGQFKVRFGSGWYGADRSDVLTLKGISHWAEGSNFAANVRSYYSNTYRVRFTVKHNGYAVTSIRTQFLNHEIEAADLYQYILDYTPAGGTLSLAELGISLLANVSGANSIGGNYPDKMALYDVLEPENAAIIMRGAALNAAKDVEQDMQAYVDLSDATARIVDGKPEILVNSTTVTTTPIGYTGEPKTMTLAELNASEDKYVGYHIRITDLTPVAAGVWNDGSQDYVTTTMRDASGNSILCGVYKDAYFADDYYSAKTGNLTGVVEKAATGYAIIPQKMADVEPFADTDYTSQDMSGDGKVTIVQQAADGNGIDLVLMGDAYTDRQIASGKYRANMDAAIEAFFSEEPYKSYKHLFNIYIVDVVSAKEGYDGRYANDSPLDTTFGEGTLEGTSTSVSGYDKTVMEYAKKAISADRMDDATLVVIMNKDLYAGTCCMYYTNSGDYGRGTTIAYFPAYSQPVVFGQLMLHEAGGHGFAKLADEYSYEENGVIPSSEVSNRRSVEPYGWWKNTDFTSDPTAVKWSKFLSDERYAGDGLGVFEGGFTYPQGVWHSTENSIMNHNTGGYNAPSREAIYYRIHKLAYGADWVYDYEEFVSYDAKNIKPVSRTRTQPAKVDRSKLPPHTPPVVYPYSWRDAK